MERIQKYERGEDNEKIRYNIGKASVAEFEDQMDEGSKRM